MSLSLTQNLFDNTLEETAGERLFFKLFEALVVTLTAWTAWSWGFYIPKIQDTVLSLGIAIYVDLSMLSLNGLSLINAALISGLLGLGYFRRWRYAYFIAFLLLHVQFAARYRLGEIPHSSNMLGMTLLGLSIAMIAFSTPQQRRRFTMGFTYFFIGLGYTLAAFCKLIATGITWPDGRHLWLWLGEKSVDTLSKTGLYEPNLLQIWAMESHTMATLFLTVGLLTEVFAFLMWWRRFRYPVVMAVLILHVGIYFMMDIIFAASMYELLFLALPWAGVIDHVMKTGGQWTTSLDQFSRTFA